MAIGKDTALRLMLVDDQVNEAEGRRQQPAQRRHRGASAAPGRSTSWRRLHRPAAGRHGPPRASRPPCCPSASGDGGDGLRRRDVPLLAVLDSITDEILDSVQAQNAQGGGAARQAAAVPQERPHRMARPRRTSLAARAGSADARDRAPLRHADRLLRASRSPIHEGMHIRANQAYLDMFGYESFEDIEACRCWTWWRRRTSTNSRPCSSACPRASRRHRAMNSTPATSKATTSRR